ncbi:HNH endonuclease signature motif containing protein [Cumulibacter soli]|uniref:HNH endonuclease signature motif containing protein n=1 Tax=Cumulibacter soli TaxID=2546344 RepID=UPI0010674B05|nr:HNH endonuclease signature motif containing protein [Cumulibacter soli]
MTTTREETDTLRFVPADARVAAAVTPEGVRCLHVASDLSTRISESLGRFADALDDLITFGERGELLALDPACLLKFAAELESHRARSIQIDNYVYQAAGDDLDHFRKHTGESSIARGLATHLRLSLGEAYSRARRAHAMLPRADQDDEEQPAPLPSLTAALARGEITSGQLDEIEAAMRRMGTIADLDCSLLEQAEQTLVADAATLSPIGLRKTGEDLDRALHADESCPDPKIAEARRALTIGAQRHDGTYAITGYLTAPVKAQLESVLSPLSAPRPAADGTPDVRTAPQRRHDALGDLAQRLLDLAGVPASGGTATTVHINVDMDAILDALNITDTSEGVSADHDGGDDDQRNPTHSDGGDGAAVSERNRSRYVGRIAGGDRITLDDFLHLADEALLIPTWMSDTGGIVAYGRARRIATENQTHALIARDHGCSYPTCDAPPDWSQRHHVVEWWRDGATDLNNLTLVCGHHHRNFEASGWRVDIIDGLPWWTPPEHIDPDRVPRLNPRIRIPSQHEIENVARQASAARAKAPKNLLFRYSADSSDGDGLDPVDDLIPLLAAHVNNPHQRNRFHQELADLLAAYLDTGSAIPAGTGAVA